VPQLQDVTTTIKLAIREHTVH